MYWINSLMYWINSLMYWIHPNSSPNPDPDPEFSPNTNSYPNPNLYPNPNTNPNLLYWFQYIKLLIQYTNLSIQYTVNYFRHNNTGFFPVCWTHHNKSKYSVFQENSEIGEIQSFSVLPNGLCISFIIIHLSSFIKITSGRLIGNNQIFLLKTPS